MLRLLFLGATMETTKLQFGVIPPKVVPLYAGPFPRGKHSHRCQTCGQGTYCYKAECKLPQKIELCRWCRPVR